MVLQMMLCAAATSASIAAIVVASLRFARWSIERGDRVEADRAPMTPEVADMRRATLLKKRCQFEKNLLNAIQSGSKLAESVWQRSIHDVDLELSRIGRSR